MRVAVQGATWLILAFLTGFSPRAAAQPATLHEQQRISVPAAYVLGAFDVCLRGADLLAIARRGHPDPDREPLGEVWALLHFKQQANGDWQFVTELASVQVDDASDFWGFPDLDCEGPVAAFSVPGGTNDQTGGTPHIAEFTSAGLQVTALTALSGGSHVDVYRGTVAIGGQWRTPTTVALVRKNAAGQWADVTYAVGNPGNRFDTVEITGPNYLWLAATELGATGTEYEPVPSVGHSVSDMQVFDRIGGSWPLTSTLNWSGAIGAVINDRLALKLDEGTAPGDVGSYFVRDAAGAWTVQHILLSDEQMFPWDAVFIGERALVNAINRDARKLAVFRLEAPRRYRHEATLSPSSLISTPGTNFRFSVDGERVAMAAEGMDILLFRLPPPLVAPFRLERSFSSPSTADWSFSGLTDWRIVSSAGSGVFRQLRTDGWARAVLERFSGTDQSIQADVRIHELAASSAGAGFLLRYTDLQNYYYLLVHRNSLEVGKIANGVFKQIATARLSLVLGRTYRFRIEAIGTHVRAFVNGERVVDVIDNAHARGRTGLTMFRARTDYDNVIVTSNPQTVLFAHSFDQDESESFRTWTSNPANAWSSELDDSGIDGVYRQSLLTGTPRALNGALVRDQIVSAIVRPQAFNAGVANAFVGLMGRHVDDFNHYYVALFRDRAALRKRVNGVHSSIREVPFAVTPGVAYRVRFEAIGSSLRLYVNDRLMTEAQDATLPTGRYGLITFNATADFDDFLAVRP